MSLHPEQQQILENHQSCIINSPAGTGKTYTLAQYAKNHPSKKILYLSINKSSVEQFNKLIQQYNIKNTKACTIYSLAKKTIYGERKINLTGNLNYLTVNKLINHHIQHFSKEKQNLITFHVINAINNFCISKEKKIYNFNYLEYVNKTDTSFVEKNNDIIIGLATDVLKKMHENAIPIIHNYYLKLFQIKQITLPYDIIMIDEAQDSLPCFLDVIEKQNCIIFFSGDIHQEIFRWSGTINPLTEFDLPQFNLIQNRRFCNNIHTVINSVIEWKNILFNNKNKFNKLEGTIESTSKNNIKAYISRNSATVLNSAIKELTSNKSLKIYFNGGLNSYISHNYGFTITDVYELFKTGNNKNPFLRNFNYFSLKNFADQTNDYVIKSFIRLCDEDNYNLKETISLLENKSTDHPSQAEAIFTTAHRTKGNEYNHVQILNDFYTVNELTEKRKSMNNKSINDEINLLYIAVSRASNKLEIPQKYLIK